MTVQRALIHRPRESGQALIFVAILMPALVGMLGLAIVGGQAFVRHQQLQSAADAAAIVGAQALPCATDDTTCIQNSESLACTYAAKNGFSGCTPGAAIGSNANVPPLSCSPYDFMSFGNSSNPNCKTASAPPYYDFVEVRLSTSLGTVPIFDIPVNIYAHAVAKRGVSSPHGDALIALGSQGISMTDSNQTVLEGSAYSNGSISGNGSDTACGGGWTAAGTVSGVSSGSLSSLQYSPFRCGTGTGGSSLTASNQPAIQDPYAGSVPPTASVWSGSTCPECAQPGWWYDLVGQTWGQGGTPLGMC
ncbi:MAG: TadE/TadG family type IV pilus assembly protein, partial [Chloroflexota bacterium]